MSAAPDWLTALVTRQQQRLGLSEWRVDVEVSPAPGGSSGNRGSCTTTPAISRATVTIRDDLPDDAATAQTVTHELLHIAHARVNQFVRGVLIPELAPAAQALARQAYRDVMEPFIERLANVLCAPEEDSDGTDQHHHPAAR